MDLPGSEDFCHENAYTKVSWNESCQYLHIAYKGVFVGNNFYEGDLLQVESLASRKGCRILYDLRQYPVSTQTNLKWILGDFLPKMQASGLTHIAAVMPEEFYGKGAASYILARFSEQGRLRSSIPCWPPPSGWASCIIPLEEHRNQPQSSFRAPTPQAKNLKGKTNNGLKLLKF